MDTDVAKYVRRGKRVEYILVTVNEIFHHNFDDNFVGLTLSPAPSCVSMIYVTVRGLKLKSMYLAMFLLYILVILLIAS